MRQPGKGASTPSIRAASAAMLGMGALLAAAVVTFYQPATSTHSNALATVLGVAMVGLHVRPRRSVVGAGGVETIHLDEVIFVPLLLVVAPWQSIVIVSLGSLTGSLVARRQWLKTVFNLGQLVFATALAIIFVALWDVGPSSKPNLPETLVGMAGALLLTATSTLLVRGMVSYVSGKPLRQELTDIRSRLLPWSGAVSLGGVGAICVGEDPRAAILVLFVVAFVHRAYAASVREAWARRQSQQVQQAIVSLRTYTDPARVRSDLVSTTRGLLGARQAEIVAETEQEPASALSAPLLPGSRLRVTQRLGVDTWDDVDRDTLLTLAGVAGDVIRAAELIARLRTITNSQSEGVIALDLIGRVTFANPAAVHMLGDTSEEAVLGRRLEDMFKLRHRRLPIDFAGMITSQIAAQDADASLGPEGGETLDIVYSITPLRAEGEHVGAVLVLRDVTERRAFQDELARRALHDELTGLPNRRLLIERLDHALARTRNTGAHHGLLFLDLDRFKLVNDSFGHLVGDQLLAQVGHRLRGGLSPVDSVARLSGDEFLVLIEDVADMEAVTGVAERLLQILQEPHEVESHHIFMSASIGVGITQDAQSRDELLAAVDAAANAAKVSGRNCYCVTTDPSVDDARARLDLEMSLRQGIDSDELELHYQPIVRAGSGDVVGAEALVRWRSPSRGVLWPQQFVPVAEETGLVVPMGRWVLEQACRNAVEWTIAHQDRVPLSVSVNLSSLQFAQHRLVEDVEETLRSTGLPASQLCLEITETVLMHDTAGTQATLESLHNIGVSVAIDDFGTGYSSLSYLKRFAIDVVKLDKAFIENVASDEVDAEIAKAVIRLSKALNIATVAEGVETEEQRQMLVRMGCPLIQGYLMSRPLPAADFLTFWNSGFATASDAEKPHVGTSGNRVRR